jgi:glycosyltransferase involved in cell wall biosynthesis
VSDAVEFLGAVASDTVIDLMRRAAIVVIPSRHEYSEGFPLTIFEALCARTPIVASDHPMFRHHLVNRQSAMVFHERHERELAQRVIELMRDPNLYGSLSDVAVATWEAAQVPVKWTAMIQRWLSDAPADRAWLESNAVGSVRTASAIARPS